ncbi:hypothetical protein IV73_GL001274 [Weissella kandleri]|uniref:PucR C-terminal helix-turn-helix domain-containing protein n=1 Tax=Weissella kandleri TaxID=1616 RepID=A0A0R2JB54_9LACO|nr:helix-turn-helix domain-containing protein [Weissella kandleri]KRN74478.1 hypothetical protein IV73_GL001274 [Weissella kandleri]
MGISKKEAQALLNQNFYHNALNLTILDPNGNILATNYNSASGRLSTQSIQALIKHVNQSTSKWVETSDLDGNTTCINTLFQEELLIGYLLIFGPTEQVKGANQLILTIVNMYLNSNYKFDSNMPLTDRERSDIFVRELLLTSKNPRPSLKEEAEHFNLNIENPIYVAVIYASQPIKKKHPLYNLRNRINGRSLLLKDNVLVLVFSSNTALEYINSWKDDTMHIGVSTKRRDFSAAYHEAVETILLLEWLDPEQCTNNQIHDFNEFEALLPLIDAQIDVNNLVETLAQLDRNYEHHELIHTFWYLLKNDGHIKPTADDLHIHRNTLTFRIESLSKLLNMDLQAFDQRVLVYIALLKYFTYGLTSALEMADKLLEADAHNV